MRHVCLTICCAVAACGGGDATATAPSPRVEGEYHLVSVDGVAPPVRIANDQFYGRTLVARATLFVRRSTNGGPQEYAGFYHDSLDVVFPDVTNPPGAIRQDFGDVYLAASRVAFVSWMSGSSQPGVATDADVTILKDGRRWLYGH